MSWSRIPMESTRAGACPPAGVSRFPFPPLLRMREWETGNTVIRPGWAATAPLRAARECRPGPTLAPSAQRGVGSARRWGGGLGRSRGRGGILVLVEGPRPSPHDVRSACDDLVAPVASGDAAVGDECSEHVADGRGAHLGLVADLPLRHRRTGLPEDRLDALLG